MDCFINYSMSAVLNTTIKTVCDEYQSQHGRTGGVGVARFHLPRVRIILNMNPSALHKALLHVKFKIS